MKISSNVKNKNQEVVISANPKQLRILSNWLETQAELLENRKHQFEHAHIKNTAKEWHEKWPDIIVQNPSINY